MNDFPVAESTRTASVVVQRTRGFNSGGFAAAVPLFMAGIFGFATNRGVPDRGIFIAGAVFVFLLLVAYVLVMSPRLKQETVTADGDRLIYRGVWHTRSVEVKGGRAVNLAYSMSWQTYHCWLFLDESGIVKLRLQIGTWSASALTNLATDFGLNVQVVSKPMKPSEARRAYPGSFSWPAAHQFATGIFVVCGFFIALVVGIAIVQALAK